ncbi:MAG: glycosyltransferase, partial [Actinomycetota bacterium]|nr:glycosyltransferase [Actinomycetota bacterium]
MGEQTRPVDVVLVDNGSTDDSVEVARRELPEVRVVEIGRNLGFGPAINRAVVEAPGDPVILLNNDAVPEPRFVEALLDGLGEGVETVAGVLLQEPAPELIDSAGVVADATRMGFDYLHGEQASAAAAAPAPLGPTGGAALY